MSIINPAFTGTAADMEFNMGNQRMLGNLSKISSYYALANYRITGRKHTGGPFSALGISIYNDQEGKYLNRSRIYLNYAWHANILTNTKISGGLSFGAMNYSVKGTPLSGNGSDLRADAAAGIQVYRKSFWLGVSVNQLFNSEVQPLQEITVLAPYMNIMTGIKFELGEKFCVTPSASLRFPLSGVSQLRYRNLYDVNLQVSLLNKIQAGLGFHDNEKMVITLGLENIIPAYGQIDFLLSYAFLVRENSNLSTPLLEIGVVYRKSRK